jgi:hypothetical protein
LGKEGGKVIKQYVTFICDNCGEEYLINDTMEAPPQWLIIKCSIVNTEGYINDEERDQIDHFCSVKCAIQFTENIAFQERLALSDQSANQVPDTEGTPPTANGETEEQ